MPVSRSLVRLHAIRVAEEQQRQTALDAALADLRDLQARLNAVNTGLGAARAMITSSIRSGVPEDRMAGLEQVELFERLAKILRERIALAEERLLQARTRFFAKRIERRQVETLLEAERVQAGVEESRKSQSALDEWFRSRLSR